MTSFDELAVIVVCICKGAGKEDINTTLPSRKRSSQEIEIITRSHLHPNESVLKTPTCREARGRANGTRPPLPLGPYWCDQIRASPIISFFSHPQSATAYVIIAPLISFSLTHKVQLPMSSFCTQI